MGNSYVNPLSPQKSVELPDSQHEAQRLPRTTLPVMLSDYLVGEPKKIEQFDSVGERAACQEHVMVQLQLPDHAGEEVYVRRISEIDPDFHGC